MHHRDPKKIKYFAKTNFRTKEHHQVFGIRTPEDTQYHTAIISKTGSGKSNILKSFIINDLENGRGCIVIDPHGSLVESIKNFVPTQRQGDVIDVDLTDIKVIGIGYNPLRNVSDSKRALVASGMVEILERLVEKKSFGDKMGYILFNSIMALLEAPGEYTFQDVLRLLQDKEFRSDIAKHIKNEEVKHFFTKQFKLYTPKFDFVPIYKLFQFLAYPQLKNLLVQNENSLSILKAMNESKLVFVNNNKGAIGGASELIGNLFITGIMLAGFARLNTPKKQRLPFSIYIDEAQNYASNSNTGIVAILEELRKAGIQIYMAFQSLSSLETSVKQAVFSNVGNLIVMRTSAEDGLFLSREMARYNQPFTYEDFVLMPKYHMIVRMMIHGQPCLPFTASSIVYKDYF